MLKSASDRTQTVPVPHSGSRRDRRYLRGRHAIRLAATILCALTLAPKSHAQLAPTPPMGWNSWDSYGLTINEADFKANASVLASSRRFGWQYAVIDEGWYLQNPFAEDKEPRQYIIDLNGLLIPATERFPSAAQGHTGSSRWPAGLMLKG